MIKYLLLLSFFITTHSIAQKASYIYRDKNDSSINCYLKIVPENLQIKGLIIRDYSSLPDIKKKSPYKLAQLIVQNGFVMLYTTTSKYFPELGYTEAPAILLDEIINEIIMAHGIPTENIFIGGISASGTRALQYTRFCNEGKSKYGVKIKGVFAVDPPLDFERFYYSVTNNSAKFKNGMAEEAALMMKVFPNKLGSPEKNLDKYRERSIYSQFATNGGNATFFKSTPLIIFHEPDMDWWQIERGASYYDINSFDIIGFSNQLIALGNKEVVLITSSGKGFENGERKCHSWSIVDEEFLLQWILHYTTP